MLIISFFLLLIFLFWGFFASSTFFCLERLGEYRTLELLHDKAGKSIYFSLHRLLFPRKSFDIFLAAVKISATVATLGFAGFSFLFLFLFPLTGPVFWVIGILIFLFFGILFLDFFPILISLKNAEKGLLRFFSLISLLLYLSFPIAFIFLKLQEKKSRIYEESQGADPYEQMKETILEILIKSNVQGKLSNVDKKLLESVVKFKDRIVREVMVPRVDLFCLPMTATIREAAAQLMEEGYSRVPIYKETIDNIVGVLMFKDILELYMECEAGVKDSSHLNAPIEEIMKRPFYTPETKKASQLLQEFRSRQMHMAIVIDEYGGTEGVVTMEDTLEVIVGEIADEYDFDEEELYTTQPDGESWIVDARMNVLDAEDIFGIVIPTEGDYDTLGGYLFHHFGSIPHPGQILHHENFSIEILSSSERSVEQVRVSLKKGD